MLATTLLGPLPAAVAAGDLEALGRRAAHCAVLLRFLSLNGPSGSTRSSCHPHADWTPPPRYAAFDRLPGLRPRGCYGPGAE